ncbi:MAG: hypothetical protein IJW48_04980 [Clostridia bacterium]|nr:hypothetical protein [Clostridia bacterium]
MTDNPLTFPEISVHVKPTNKLANYIVYASLISAALCIGVCFFIESYQGIFGIIAMAFITAAIFFYTKYLSAEYIYDLLTDRDGLPLFIIRSRTGRRETTLARLDLYAIRKLERLTREELKGRKSDTGVTKYTYAPTFRPAEAVLLTVRSRYERSDVIIEAPKEFTDLLSRSADLAREMYSEDGE